MIPLGRVSTNLGLLIMRVGIGLIMTRDGIPKLLKGYESWQWLGSQMQHVGITFFPTFWGFCAAVTMAVGGAMLAVGLHVRLVSALLAFTMLVALMMHIRTGDSFREYSHALSMLVVFIGLFFTGGGSHSIDSQL